MSNLTISLRSSTPPQNHKYLDPTKLTNECRYSEATSETRRLESKMAAKAAAPVNARTSGSRSPQQRYRPLSQSFSTGQFRHPPMPSPAPLTPDAAYQKLEQENTELKEDVESLTMMVERLRSEGERARIRQVNASAKSASVAFLQGSRSGAGTGSKSTPSPATVSALDLTTTATSSSSR